MKHKMLKKIISCLLYAFLFICTKDSFSQFTTVQTKFSTPRGNITVPTMVYTPRYYYNGNKYESRKHNFTIVLLNDSTIEAKATINIEDSIHTLEWGKKENKIVIRPSETKEIFRTEDGMKISGIPADSCWLFLVDNGKIKTYSITSERDYPIIAYIQNGNDGPIFSLTKENLIGMINNNEKAMKLAEKGKLLKSVEVYNKE